jgi:hypothetical protein
MLSRSMDEVCSRSKPVRGALRQREGALVIEAGCALLGWGYVGWNTILRRVSVLVGSST